MSRYRLSPYDMRCSDYASHRGSFFFFFFNDTATTEIYTLSPHDALPICRHVTEAALACPADKDLVLRRADHGRVAERSEEHTSELQSQSNLVCRLLLEKKKHIIPILITTSPLTPVICYQSLCT